MNNIYEIVKNLNIDEKNSLIERICEIKKNENVKDKRKKASNQIVYPNNFVLSSAQERLWFLEKLEGPNPRHNICCAIYIKGKLNKDLLKESINLLTLRQWALRTVIQDIDGDAFQKVLDNFSIRFHFLSFSNLPKETISANVQREISKEADTIFRLNCELLIKFKLIEIFSTEFIFIITMHHIISDAFSINILFSELFTIYHGLSKESSFYLKDIDKQYVHYANEAKYIFDSEKENIILMYWQEKLKNAKVGIPIFGEKKLDFTGMLCDYESIVIAKDQYENILKLCKVYKCSLFMYSLAIFNVSLFLLTGQEDISITTPFSVRDNKDYRNVIGIFINVLLLRNVINPISTFENFLITVKETCLDGYQNSSLPFERIVNKVKKQTGWSDDEKLQVSFALEKALNDNLLKTDIDIMPIPIKGKMPKNDLSLFLYEGHNEVTITCEYNTAKLSKRAVRLLLETYNSVLKEVLTNSLVILYELKSLIANKSDVFTEEYSSQKTKKDTFSLEYFLYDEVLSNLQNTKNCLFYYSFLSKISPSKAFNAFFCVYENLSKQKFFKLKCKSINCTDNVCLDSNLIDLSLEAKNGINKIKDLISNTEKQPLNCAILEINDRYLFCLAANSKLFDLSSLDFIFLLIQYASLNSQENVFSLLNYSPMQNIFELLYYKQNIYLSPDNMNPQEILYQLHSENKIIPSVNSNDNFDKFMFKIDKHQTKCIDQWLKTSIIAGSEVDNVLVFFQIILAIYFYKTHSFSSIKIGFLKNIRDKGLQDTIGMFDCFIPILLEIIENETFNSLHKKIAENSIISNEKIESSKLSHSNIDLIYDFIIHRNYLDSEYGWYHLNSRYTEKANMIVEINQLSEFSISIEVYTNSFSRKINFDSMDLHLNTIIDTVLKNPQAHLDDIPIDLKRISFDNNIKQNLEPGVTVSEILTDSCRKNQNKIAIVHGNASITYAELNSKANIMANYLSSYRIGPKSIVAILMDSSIEYIISILAVLKTGSAYLPIDVKSPKKRIEYILSDSDSKIILTKSVFLDLVPGNKIRVIDINNSIFNSLNNSEPATDKSPNDPAYAIYTSGSTGNPKGVLISDYSLVNFIYNSLIIYKLTNQDRVLQFASIAFDASVEEIFSTLSSGGTLIIRTDDMISSYKDFLNICDELSITVLDLPTAFWNFLVTDIDKDVKFPTKIRLVIIGGEQVLKGNLDKWLDIIGTSPELINTYGPTETTVIATYANLSKNRSSQSIDVPIGCPIDNVQTIVVNEDLNVVPIGSIGELYIGGAGVALGYKNDDELNRKHFINGPIGDLPLGKFFKTGDYVKILPDGSLSFIERKDDQIKIRGHRIEITEITNLLNQYEGIHKSVTLPITCGESHNTKIIVFAKLETSVSVNTADVRNYLKDYLTPQMLPNDIIIVEDIPLTINNKIDQERLKSIYQNHILNMKDKHKNKKIGVLHSLLSIFREVLQIEHVDENDNFFDIGGHSFLAIKLVSRIEKEFSMNFPLKLLFQLKQVKDISTHIDNSLHNQIHTKDSEKTEIDFLNETEISLPKRYQNNYIIETNSILLTGCTGFLGSFILYELLKSTNAQIYCLVRDDQDDCKNRILTALTHFQLDDLNPEVLNRIVPIPGDLSKTMLGQNNDNYEFLSNTIDMIIHNGAIVNGIYPYSYLKDTNVTGTKEIINLSINRRYKLVNYISSLNTFDCAKVDGIVKEEDEPKFSERIYDLSGYVQSKWVAEQLMLNARKQGAIINIIRPGLITGSSVSGVWNVSDHMAKRIVNIVNQRAALDVDIIPSWTPVDYAAKVIVQLSLIKENNHNWHVYNRYRISIKDLVEYIRMYGYYITFFKKETPPAHLPSKSKYIVDNFVDTFNHEVKIDCSNTENALEGTGLRDIKIDEKIVFLYLKFFESKKLIPRIAG